MSTKSKKSGFKKFPFAWRANWLKLMQESPTAAAVWAYMWWRSDEHGVFDLCEDLMCLDLGLNPKTLQKAQALIHHMGGFKRECERNDKGQLIVRYRMLPFTNPSTEIYLSPTPNIGCESLSQKTGVVPSPNLLSTEKRGHTVDTVPVTPSPNGGLRAIPEPVVDTSNPRERKVGKEQVPPPSATAVAPPSNPKPREVPASSKVDAQANQKKNQKQPLIIRPRDRAIASDRAQAWIGQDYLATNKTWLTMLFPGLGHTQENLFAMAECLESLRVKHGIPAEHSQTYLTKLLEYNKAHQAKDSLIFRGPVKFANALWSDAEDSLVAREAQHDENTCRICMKKTAYDKYQKFEVTGICKICKQPKPESASRYCDDCIKESQGFDVEEPESEPEPKKLCAECAVRETAHPRRDYCKICYASEPCKVCRKKGENVNEWPCCYHCLVEYRKQIGDWKEAAV
jgi:hypothetical protein